MRVFHTWTNPFFINMLTGFSSELFLPWVILSFFSPRVGKQSPEVLLRLLDLQKWFCVSTFIKEEGGSSIPNHG